MHLNTILKTNIGHTFNLETQLNSSILQTNINHILNLETQLNTILQTGTNHILNLKTQLAANLYHRIGKVYISLDRGVTWSHLSAGLQSWQTIAVSSDSSVIIISYDNGVAVSINGGSTWTNYGFGTNLYPVAISGNGNIMLVGDTGSSNLYISINYGITWTTTGPLLSLGSWWTTSISRDGSTLLAGQYNIGLNSRSLFKSLDNGTSWIDITPPTSNDQYWNWSTISADGNIIYITSVPTTGPGKIFKSIDQGVTWIELISPSNQPSNIDCSDDGQTILLCDKNTDSFVSINGGSTWTNQGINNPPTTTTPTSVGVSFDGSVLAVPVFNGDIWTTAGQGQDFALILLTDII